MKKGDVINGYRLLSDFTTAGGGLSRWAFAEKNGEQFFLKEFLAPTYPLDTSPGSPETKRLKRERCMRFEQHHRALKDAVASCSGRGGNLVATIDFFRVGTKYYKVTEKVDVCGLGIEEIAGLPLGQRILIMLTVVHSLNVLHQLGIVHGDLKPGNILIKMAKRGDFVAKLIDFDNSYFAGKPPEREEIVGDMAYYSPELARYIVGDNEVRPEDLQTSSDIFALGLVFCQYCTGALPRFNPKYRYACDAANAGEILRIDRGVPETLSNLINRMMSTSPSNRPTTRAIFQTLKGWNADVTESPTSSRLSGTLVRPKSGSKPSDGVIQPPGSSKLRGTLIDKKR